MPGHVRPGHVCLSKVMFRPIVVRSSQFTSGKNQVRSGKVSSTSVKCLVMSGQDMSDHVRSRSWQGHTQVVTGQVRSRKVRSAQNASDHMMSGQVKSCQFWSRSLSSGQSGQAM